MKKQKQIKFLEQEYESLIQDLKEKLKCLSNNCDKRYLIFRNELDNLLSDYNLHVSFDFEEDYWQGSQC